MRCLTLTIATTLAFTAVHPPARSQVSLDNLCRSFPNNSRCLRMEQGLPAVQTGLQVPSADRCTPLMVEGRNSTEIEKNSSNDYPNFLRFVGLRNTTGTTFTIQPDSSYDRAIATLLSTSISSSYNIEMDINYSDGSSERVFSVMELPMTEQHLHGFGGTIQPERQPVSASVYVSKPGGSNSGRYKLSVFGCEE